MNVNICNVINILDLEIEFSLLGDRLHPKKIFVIEILFLFYEIIFFEMISKNIMNLINKYMDKVYVYNDEKLYSFSGFQWKFICDIPFKVDKMILIDYNLYFSVWNNYKQEFKLLTPNNTLRDICIPENNGSWSKPLNLLKEIEQDNYNAPESLCDHDNNDGYYCIHCYNGCPSCYNSYRYACEDCCNYVDHLCRDDCNDDCDGECKHNIKYQDSLNDHNKYLEIEMKDKTAYYVMINNYLYTHQSFFKRYDGCTWKFMRQKKYPQFGRDLLFYNGFIYSFSDTIGEKYEIKTNAWSIIYEWVSAKQISRVTLFNSLFYLIYNNSEIEIYNPLTYTWKKDVNTPFVPNDIIAVSQLNFNENENIVKKIDFEF